MGIRTTCPNGHKLNVKAFLAGLRGICPHCGASFTIPTESTRPSSKARNGEPQSRTTDPATDAEAEIEISTREPHPPVGAAEPASPGPVKKPPPLPAGGIAAAGTAPQSAPEQPAAWTPSVSTPKNSPLSVSAPSAPREPLDAVPTQPAGSQSLNQSSAPLSSFAAPISAPVSDPLPFASPTSTPQVPDPLAEAPNAVWYVRPASGGQFGPATNDIMRAWLKEGRIGPDSLVWREGWRDWKEASATFPQFSADPGNLANILANSEPMPLHPTPTLHAPARRRMDGAGILLICLLFVVVVVLVAILCWVLLRQGGATTASTVGAPSRAMAAFGGPARPWNEPVL